jgi:predicted secreted hydrolase
MRLAGQTWCRYPFDLVPGSSEFRFPEAEGEHPQYESDTWFVAGELTADATGRRFAFLTIFTKNRIGLKIVADFYTFALFDLDNGAYGTFTDYDVPPANMQPGAVHKMSMATGYLDIAYVSSAGESRWQACRDDDGELIPYTYDVVLVGTDQNTQSMELRLRVTPTRAPVPLGASAHGGKIACYGQDNTYSYFQTRMAMTGTLRWGGVSESVSGDAGHVDRQWFPEYSAAGGPGGDPRSRSHEWRTINLDNGVDLSIWRQFDRTDHNAPQPFSGATTCSADSEPRCAEDIEVTVVDYVRWPESIATLVPPPSAARYMPDRHRLTSRQLDLDLTGEPLVAAPGHGLPIDYMEGPYLYRGTMGGQPVSGFAFFERTLAMHRDWELAEVFETVAAGSLAALAARVRVMIGEGRRKAALDCLESERAGIDALNDPKLSTLVGDLIGSLQPAPPAPLPRAPRPAPPAAPRPAPK